MDTRTVIIFSAEDVKPSNLLRIFPPEIRGQIFELTLDNCWEGKTPALLKALYGDREVYIEAIKVFYRVNTFFSSRNNGWGDDFPDHLLPTVTNWKIMIIVEESKLMLGSRDEDLQTKCKPTKDVWRFAKAHKLEKIHFICEQMFVLDEVERILFADQTVLRKVEVSFSSFWHTLSTAGMDSLDARFGVRGYLATVGTTTDITLFWKAPKGEVLKILEPTTPLKMLLDLRPDLWEFYPELDMV